MMKGRRSPGSSTSLFIVFLLSAIHHAVLHVCANSYHTVRLPLVHRYSPGFITGSGLMNKTDTEIAKALHLHDIIRRQRISQRKHSDDHQIPRRKDTETSSPYALPLHSGFDILSGLYWVEVRVGTPPKPFFLVADTGSDLTWVRCQYDPKLTKEAKEKLVTETKIHHHVDPKKRSHLLNTKGRVFRADLSSTFKPIPCSDGMCNRELVQLHAVQNCPTPSSPCRYHYTYLGGNGAVGFFGHDTITMPLPNGSRAHLPNMTIGCTQDTQKLDEGDGIIGLGFGDTSFPDTIVKSKLAAKFSYCLMNHRSNSSVASYLTFGPNNQAVTSPMRYTKLVLNDYRHIKTGFYGVNVEGISIGGTLLKIPSQIWEEMLRGGGITFDSGSTNTWLSLPIYQAVMDELTKALSIYKKVDLNDKGIPFEFCFNDKGYNESLVPRIAFHFAGGVIFDPPVRNYVLDVAEGVKCLGFVPSFDGSSMIGNQMQQNYLWEYDIGRGTVGYAPSSCT